MQQLEEERAELVKWQALDKQRRGLQYAIHDADLADASEKLAQVRTPRHEMRNHGARVTGPAGLWAVCAASLGKAATACQQYASHDADQA